MAGELARRFSLGTDLVLSIVSPRVGAGGLIQGRLEGGLLYTSAFVARVKAQLRGAVRAATTPVLVASITKEIGLEVSIAAKKCMLAYVVC